MPRHKLTDEQWARILPLLPPNGYRGGQWKDHRMVVDAMVWRLRTGAPWRDLPEEYGPWQSVYGRFNRWCSDGTLKNIADCLLIELDNDGLVDWDLWCIDGTVIRGSRAAAGARTDSVASHLKEPADHALGRSKGGFGTKIHLICDGQGVPLAVQVTPGQTHESTRCEPLTQSLLEEWPDVLPQKLAGDKAYSAGRIRRWLIDRWIEPVIAHQKSERVPGDEDEFDKATYRRRGVIEQSIGWLKECRALATRFDKLATNFLGTVHLAFVLRYLRILDS